MKRFLLLGVILLSFYWGEATTIHWDGGGGNTAWSDALNWDNNAVPGQLDDVVLDNSLYVLPYQVDLPDGDVSITVYTLTISPSGGNFIALVLPSANTSPTGFKANGPGNAIIINEGGYFQNSSGAISGTPVAINPAAKLRINNGGIYVHNTARDHASLVSRLSTAAGTENGLFWFDAPVSDYTIATGNYGNLQLSALSSGSYLIGGSGNLNVAGDLIIDYGVDISSSMSGEIVVHGGYYQYYSNSSFNLQSGAGNNIVKLMGNVLCGGTITETGSGSPQLQLVGTSAQSLAVYDDAGISNHVVLNVNNPAGVVLATQVKLPYKLLLTNGKVVTSPDNMLVIDYGAICTGGSAASFVDGPLRKIGNEDFVFPVGKGGIYAPIGISGATASSAVDDEFVAEYIRDNPQSTSPYGPAHAANLNHVSYVEYWTLEQTQNMSSRNVSLDVHAESFCRKLDSTYIARWNGVEWTKLQTTVSNGPTQSGIYQTGRLVSTDNPGNFYYPMHALTLSTDLLYLFNPLPLNLISFNASKINPAKSLLVWELAECCPSSSKFELQRAGADKSFKTFASVGGNETSRFYNLTDNSLKAGVNYYRLKMIDPEGSVSYSKVVVLMNGGEGSFLASLAPTVVRSNADLTACFSRAQKITVVIVDMNGRMVQQQTFDAPAGNTTINVSAARLPAGAYNLFAICDEGKTNVIRFLKQ